MRNVLILVLLISLKFGYSQVFTVENYYMVLKNAVNKAPKNFKVESIENYLNTLKAPIDVVDKRIDGHIFVNIFTQNHSVKETTLMYGIYEPLDKELVEYMRGIDVSWLGIEKSDSLRRIVIGIRVDYRYCNLFNIKRSNLAIIEPTEDTNLLEKTVQSYNKYEKLFLFDSASISSYSTLISKSKKKKNQDLLQTMPWYKPEFSKKQIELDFDNDGMINTIIQHGDSVFIVENAQLIFSERGQLQTIKTRKESSIIELENV